MVAKRQLTASIVTFAIVLVCGLALAPGQHRVGENPDRVAWSMQPPIIKTTARTVPSARPQAADRTKADRRS